VATGLTMGASPTRRPWATLAALSSIVRSIGASSSQLQWMVDVYAVVFAGLLLSHGALGDRVGRKSVFTAGPVVFAGGSPFATWSQSPRTARRRGLLRGW